MHHVACRSSNHVRDAHRKPQKVERKVCCKQQRDYGVTRCHESEAVSKRLQESTCPACSRFIVKISIAARARNVSGVICSAESVAMKGPRAWHAAVRTQRELSAWKSWKMGTSFSTLTSGGMIDETSVMLSTDAWQA